jgi:hypothetical protein
MDSDVQPVALPTGMQMPPEHWESPEQGSPVGNGLPDSRPPSLPEPDSPPSFASDVPLSAPLVESGGPESVGAPPSRMTRFDSEQAVVSPMRKSARTLRSIRRRDWFMVDPQHQGGTTASKAGK